MTHIPRPGSVRIPPIDPGSALAGTEVAELLEKTKIGGGEALNIFRTMAHQPKLLKRFNVLGGAFLVHGLLPAREREIVILRVGWNCRSVYEFGQHTVIGRQAGLTDAEIAAVAALSESTVRREWRTARAWLFRELRGLAPDSA